MERTAVCSCGQLSVTIEGEPAFHGLCSCLECQKETGSAFSYSGYWPKTALTSIKGESTCWRRIAASGKWLDRYFCPRCGSMIYTYTEFAPEMVAIALGNFANPAFPPPSYAVWNKYKHPWVMIPGWCTSYEEQPAHDGADDLTTELAGRD